MAYNLIDNTFALIEDGFTKIGMGSGISAPVKRFGLFFILTTIIMKYLKPRYFYDEFGNAYPWKAISNDKRATHLPWYVVPIGIGTIVSQL